MTVFISDPLSALGPSAREQLPRRLDSSWGIWYEKTMLRSFYYIFGTRKHLRKLMNYNVILITKNPGEEYDIFRNCVIHFLYQLA